MSSTMKTPEHIVPACNLPRGGHAATEAARSTEAAEAAQWPAEGAEAEVPRRAAEGRTGCRAIAAHPLMLYGLWLKTKNPAAPAVTREAEEDWGNRRWSSRAAIARR
jgi:hypothetical protein